MADLDHDLARLAPAVDTVLALQAWRRRRTRRRTLARAVAAAAVLVLFAGTVALALVARGANRDAEVATGTEPPSGTAPPAAGPTGEPRVWAPGSVGDGSGDDALISGRLFYDRSNRCFLLGPPEAGVTDRSPAYPVVWPAGTTGTVGPAEGGSGAERYGVELPDGRVVMEGAMVRSGGGYRPDPGYGIPAACTPGSGEVAVMNPTAYVTATDGPEDLIWRSQDGEGTKDLPERVMADVLDDPSVAVGASGTPEGTTEITLETSTGATVVAEVAVDPDGRRRLVRLASAGLGPADGAGRFAVPASGTLTVTGYSGSLAGPGEVMVDAVPVTGPGTTDRFDLVESSWLRVDLVTPEGQVLRYLGPR